MITGTYTLYPAWCKIPTISEGDRTVIAATEVLDLFKAIVPRGAREKVKHCESIKKLTSVLSEYQTPLRENTQEEQRPQRVDASPTASHMPTSLEAIITAPRIHQRRTRRNIPLAPVPEEVQHLPAPAQVVQPAQTPQEPTPTAEGDPAGGD